MPTLASFQFSVSRLHLTRNSSTSDLKSISISKKLATKFFGVNVDPVGKSIQVDHQHDLTITSVFEDVPSNSTLQFDFVISFELWKKQNP